MTDCRSTVVLLRVCVRICLCECTVMSAGVYVSLPVVARWYYCVSVCVPVSVPVHTNVCRCLCMTDCCSTVVLLCVCVRVCLCDCTVMSASVYVSLTVVAR